MGLMNRQILDREDALELALELLSFAGGENTLSEDQATKLNEARVIKNWNILSLGGMERMPGINKVGDGGSSYSAASDLIAHHKDTGGTALYGIINGDLVILSGTTIAQEDAAAFTAGVLSHAVSVLNSALWITNQSDNLKKKAVGVAIATPASVPAQAYARVYQHKTRLLVEGGVTTKNRIEISRAGQGNWTAADAWSLSNDACSIDLPEDTRGCVPGFPSGNDILGFTERECFAVYNMPNVAFRPFAKIGCAAPYALAVGDEGVYIVSRLPSLGVFLLNWAGQIEELTTYNRDAFVERINFSNRIFGFYRNRRYYVVYNESNSGVSYPNRIRIYDARFKAWIERPINPLLGDLMGYITNLKYSNGNELYMASSQTDKWYEFEVGTDDEGVDTQATFKTKDCSSRDFALASGGQFPVDDVRMKLVDAAVTYNGNSGTIQLNWESDRGLHSGSKTITLASGGFILGTSTLGTGTLTSTPSDKTVIIKFPNNAVGRRFAFTIVNNGQSTRIKIKKIKIRAVAMEEA